MNNFIKYKKKEMPTTNLNFFILPIKKQISFNDFLCFPGRNTNIPKLFAAQKFRFHSDSVHFSPESLFNENDITRVIRLENAVKSAGIRPSIIWA